MLLTSDSETTVLELLVDADRAHLADDLNAASEKLWRAALQAVLSETARRGIETDGDEGIMRAVKKIGDDAGDSMLELLFGAAEELHANSTYDWIEDWEFIDYRDEIHEFVARLSEISQSHRNGDAAGVATSHDVAGTVARTPIHASGMDHEASALNYLVDADRQYLAGNLNEASDRLWQATRQAVIVEAERWGIDVDGECDSLRELSKKITSQAGDSTMSTRIMRAEALRANAQYGWMEDWEYLDRRDEIRKFVAQLLAFAHAADAGNGAG